MSLFLKPKTRKALEKMAELTGPKCGTCLPPESTPRFRCCSAIFCKMAAVTMRELGGNVEEANPGAELPYMGVGGCVIPPTLRPICTGFVCPVHLENKGFAAKWEELQKTLNADPNVLRAVNRAREAVGGLEGAINDYRKNHLVFEEKPEGAPEGIRSRVDLAEEKPDAV